MRVAVIGCGSIGSKYLDWITEAGHEVAACDPSPVRRKHLAGGHATVVFANLSEVLDWGPDRALVATPPPSHEAASLPLIEAGIPLLIEKPLAHERDSGSRILAAVEKASAPVRVVCNMRFHPAVSTIKQHLDRAGRPLSFRCVFGHRLSQMRPAGGEFARAAASGGGVVLDCIHEFDYLRWMFGPIADVQSTVATLSGEVADAEDFANVTLRFRSGVQGSLHLDFLMRQKRRGLEIIGEEANLIWLSTGRSPENCRVTQADKDSETVLFDDPALDARAGYEAMLERFLGDMSELQTVGEAYDALDAALTARAGTLP